MPVQTVVIWSATQDPSSRIPVGEKGDELASQQTAPYEMINGPGADELTVNRFWVDQASAEYWVSFVQPYNPISVSIVE